MDAQIKQISNKFSNISKKQLTSKEDLIQASNEIQLLSNLLVSHFDNEVQGLMDKHNILINYLDLVNSAKKANEMGFSFSFSNNSIILHDKDMNDVKKDKFLNPIELFNFITERNDWNEDEKNIIKLFLSNEYIFSVLNFGIIFLKAV